MEILRRAALAPYHTLAAAGTEADTLILLDNESELDAVSSDSHILGGGSNTLFVGTIAQPLVKLRLYGIEVRHEDSEFVDICAKAGRNWHELVRFTVENGWYGLENLALIPGTVGAAPVQNIGAYGVECSSCLTAVEVYDRTRREFAVIAGADCGFAYRQSHFKGKWAGQFVITGVQFRLRKHGTLQKSYPGISQDIAAPKQMFDAICAIRQAKLPDPAVHPNAGSFFHNPIVDAAAAAALAALHPELPRWPQPDGRVKLSAGWLIEQAGCKGVYHGAVGMSAQHALVLVNRGGTGEDILAYADFVQTAVAKKFGIRLIIEPTILGAALEH